MKTSIVALATALITCGAAAAPAVAQTRIPTNPARAANGTAQLAAQQPAAEPRRRLSADEQRALAPLLTAATAAQTARQAGQTPDYAQVRALLPAAAAAARGNDAKYLVARVQLSLALSTNDEAGQQTAINTLLASPSTTPAEQAQYRQALEVISARQAEAAFRRQDFQTAARLFQELATAHPENAAYRNNLAIVQRSLGNSTPLRDNLIQNIRTAEAAGRIAPENDYRNALALANEARDLNQAIDWVSKLVQNYPNNPENWRAAIAQARLRSGDETQYVIDIYRLGVAANSLQASARGNEYLGLSGELSQAGLLAEAAAVLQAGVSAGVLQSSTPTGAGRTVGAALADYQARSQRDAAGLANEARQARSAANGRYARNLGDTFYGLGRYAEAVEMYRLALTKGGEDANLLNTRIGMSLARGGQRAEAETALRAVTGPRADLAKLWLAWLARRTV